MKKRSRAVAVIHPFHEAAQSASRTFALIVDFMYGTPQRAQITMMFALALGLLGVLQMGDAVAPTVCPIK